MTERDPSTRSGPPAQRRARPETPTPSGGAPPPEPLQPEVAPGFEQLARMLGRSREGFRELIDCFDDCVFTLSLDGTIRAANRRLADVLNLPFQSIIGRNLREFMDDVYPDPTPGAIQEFCARHRWAGTVRLRLTTTGSVRFFECRIHAILTRGQVTGAGALARDITTQREIENRFTDLFNTLQEGVYFTTPDGRLLDANPALVSMLGYSNHEELMGVNVADLYVDRFLRPRVLEEVETHTPAGAREIVLRRKDGSQLICLDASTAIRDASGRVLRYQGALVDITERRAMEQRLHREQEFARRLVDSFPDLVVAMDTEGRYTYVSPNVEELLGFAPEELVGQSLGGRSAEEDVPRMMEMFTDIVTGRRTFASLEYRTRHKDGSWRVFRATASPLHDAQGRIGGVIASARDVTEMKRLEQQVSQAEKLAAMGQMIAGVTHELNNPLTAILGITDLARERVTDPALQRQLELAHQQARRAAEIVRNLLAYARPRAANKMPVDLNELARRSLVLHEYSLRVNNIKVKLERAPKPVLVVGDQDQMIQVLLNLVANAEQAIRGVREHGTLRVAVGQSAGGAWITVEDDGPGVPEDTLPRIFDPFFTTKRPGGGTGLGLSICLSIIKEHRGTIDVQRSPLGGAAFRVLLPVHCGAGDRRNAEAADAVVVTSAASLHGRSVLVVDDEESIREIVRAGLTARGVDVVCATTGSDALSLAAARAYDAVLCDLKMPEMSGQELFDQLAREQARAQANAPRPAFIFMTGDLADPATLDFLRSCGARVIHKPFRITELAGLLAQAIESRSRG